MPTELSFLNVNQEAGATPPHTINLEKGKYDHTQAILPTSF